ncbi:Zn-ribbon domain-containing OB-fold protein [Actinomadura sp. SCN-SB]|uniref:Zn-ribbon domain-containing OB-fold protein n=1 Tax=Actinomadura sp. SCN-SB TaxID=3373092 RepID=UPI003753B2AE
MSYVAAIATYLPRWGAAGRRAAGGDEDAVTLAVQAGRAAIEAAGAGGEGVQRVVLVSRDLPLIEGGNAAVLLAGLGLGPEIEVDERLGGAPAALDEVTAARPRTLVIAADMRPAGAAAALASVAGLTVRPLARLARSLPTRARNAAGTVHDYGDPRLLRERGLLASLAAVGAEKPLALAGVDAEQAKALCAGTPPKLPTTGASSALFALAALAESRATGPLFATEQATVTGVAVSGGPATVRREEPAARPLPATTCTEGKDIPVSLAAYDRAFEPKVRFEAARHPDTGELDFPPRFRVGRDGTLGSDYTLVPLPRTGTVYTGVTVRIPVPGLPTPYSLVIVELDDVGVRVLARVTGTEPGTVTIGDRGRMVLRRVAVRSGVPDYGYAFSPEETTA